MLSRLRRRRASHDVTTPDSPDALVLADYPGIEALLDAGDVAGARALVAAAKPEASADELSRIDLQLRNEAFRRAAAAPSAPLVWPPHTDRVVTADGVPEVPAEELDREVLVASVLGHGALIVRGLFSAQACSDLRDMIDESMSVYRQDRQLRNPAWNVPLCDISGSVLGAVHFRDFNHDDTGGLPAADCPRTAAYVLAQFEELGLPRLMEAYLGERPALTLEKWMLRKVPPDTGSSWHQDGAFLGAEKHTLNMWVALSDCGERASGLDIVARRIDHIVPTGTPGAYFDWDVAPDVVERERGSQPIASPVFKAGDAIFFDQYLLHKTGIKPGLTEYRYALESWFFTPSSFPGHYNGLLL